MLSIPTSLANPELEPLRPYATHVLSTLLDSQIFHIVPESSLNAQNPTTLPREFFVADEAEPESSVEASTSNTEQGQGRPLKKKGRPTKREKAKKAREAVVSLEKWLDKNTFTAPRTAGASNVAAQPGEIMHTLMRHPPVASGEKYRAHKGRLLDALDSTYLDDVGGIRAGSLGNSEEGREVMGRANEAVLERLKKIDEMAAERGLEVGGEGGEMTGLTRVDKAVEAYREGRSRGGILNLMEGAGMEES